MAASALASGTGPRTTGKRHRRRQRQLAGALDHARERRRPVEPRRLEDEVVVGRDRGEAAVPGRVDGAAPAARARAARPRTASAAGGRRGPRRDPRSPGAARRAARRRHRADDRPRPWGPARVVRDGDRRLPRSASPCPIPPPPPICPSWPTPPVAAVVGWPPRGASWPRSSACGWSCSPWEGWDSSPCAACPSWAGCSRGASSRASSPGFEQPSKAAATSRCRAPVGARPGRPRARWRGAAARWTGDPPPARSRRAGGRRPPGRRSAHASDRPGPSPPRHRRPPARPGARRRRPRRRARVPRPPPLTARPAAPARRRPAPPPEAARSHPGGAPGHPPMRGRRRRLRAGPTRCREPRRRLRCGPAARPRRHERRVGIRGAPARRPASPPPATSAGSLEAARRLPGRAGGAHRLPGVRDAHDRGVVRDASGVGTGGPAGRVAGRCWPPTGIACAHRSHRRAGGSRSPSTTAPTRAGRRRSLAVLRREHVPATFFVVGSQAARHPGPRARRRARGQRDRQPHLHPQLADQRRPAGSASARST